MSPFCKETQVPHEAAQAGLTAPIEQNISGQLGSSDTKIPAQARMQIYRNCEVIRRG